MGSKIKQKNKTALALGAGGARGLAHIGVIEYLAKQGIGIDFVAGSSIGAIIGALYCHRGNIEAPKKKIIDLLEDEALAKKWEAFTPHKEFNHRSKPGRMFEELRTFIGRQYLKFAVMTKKSLAKRNDLMMPLEGLFGDLKAEDLQIPFAACAVDLASGKELYLKSGKLTDIIYASSAIPGIFPPLEMDGMLLADGSISDLVPIEAVPEREEHFIIAVDFGPGMYFGGELEKGMEILMRSDELARIKLNKFILELADLVISPEVKKYHWADFGHYKEIMELGYLAAGAVEQKLQSALIEIRPRRDSWWRRALRLFKVSI